MKRLILTVFAVILLCTLSACDFVRFIPYESPDEELEARREELIGEILSVSEVGFYEEEVGYRFEILLQDALNELREAKDLDSLEIIFLRHKAKLEALPKSLEATIEAVLDELSTYVSPSDYREAERKELEDFIAFYRDAVSKATAQEDAEALLRAFKADVYHLKTDAEYRAEEFADMKTAAQEELLSYLNYADYRPDGQEKIKETVEYFSERIKEAKDDEALTVLMTQAKHDLDEIPTAKALYREEHAETVKDWLDILEDEISDHELSDTFDREAMKTHLLSFATKEASAYEAACYLLSLCEGKAELLDLYRDMTVSALSSSYVAGDFRENDRREMALKVSLAKQRLEDADTELAIQKIFEETLAELVLYETNDALWQKEDTAFLQALEDRYGDTILTLPASLTEASSYEELAAIIDYYAFYQLDHQSFLRDTFRVEIAYPHKGAQYEINEVYWYCELIRSAVGITGYFEEDGNHLVIRLIPYAIATESNTSSPRHPTRYESLVTLFPDKTYTPRGEDFSDFAYLQNEKTLTGIWNTQQLWYALEQGYLPITVEDSPAERALRRAEEILREIVSDDMSIEEKAFAIFSWFGRTQMYDKEYSKYLYPEDREHFPDELAATLNSFHVEGALFDNYSVCCAFAKAYLLMLRIEGIEAYRILVHKYTENAIGNFDNIGYGSHAFVAFRGSDGKFYYSDTEECYLLTESRFPKFHQFMQIVDHRTPYEGAYARYYNELDYAEFLPDTMLRDLTYRGYSIHVTEKEALDEMLSLYAEEKDGTVISLFESEATPVSIEEVLKDDLRFDYRTFSYNGFTEYLVFHR